MKRVVLADGTKVVYTYDVDGNRVKTVTTPPNGATETLEYLLDTNDHLSQVVLEGSSTSSVAAYFVRAGDLVSVIRPQTGSAPSVSIYHADGLGSIRALSNPAGDVTDRWQFEAFGTLLGHSGSDPNAYLYAGEALDPNTAWAYHRARWLNSSVGRFGSMDPWRARTSRPLTAHRYLYASGSPVNLIDPTGWYTQQDGYAVERAVKPIYLADHPGHDVYFGSPSVVDPFIKLKPDILNRTTREYLEIKPLLFRGITKAGLQMAAYEIFADHNFYPDTTWAPRNQPVSIGTGLNVYIVNMSSVLFYTDTKELYEELLAAASIAALYSILRTAQAAQSALNEFAVIRKLVTVGSSARGVQLQNQVGMATLTRF